MAAGLPVLVAGGDDMKRTLVCLISASIAVLYKHYLLFIIYYLLSLLSFSWIIYSLEVPKEGVWNGET